MHYKRESSFRSYLYRSVRNHVVDERRRRKAYPTQIAEDPHTIEYRHTPATTLGFEDDVVQNATIVDLIHELPPDQQAVIECRYFEGLTGPATAAKLDKTTAAIYQLQHRALRRLRQAILAAAVIASVLAMLWATNRINGFRLAVDHTPADQTETTAQKVLQPNPTLGDRISADTSDTDSTTARIARLVEPPDRTGNPSPPSAVDANDTPRQDLPTTTGNQPTPGRQTPGPPVSPQPSTTTRNQTTSATSQTTTTRLAPTTTLLNTSIQPTTSTVSASSSTIAGPEQPTCNGLIATIVGTPGDDELRGTDGPDVIYGGDGKDDIYGRGGNDTICGGNGKDKIWGQKGNDYLIGGTNNEEDKLFGGQGDDTLIGNSHEDELNPGSGDDTVIPYRR